MSAATAPAALVFAVCATPGCRCKLAQLAPGWRGGPLWIKCRRCGQFNRVGPEGVRAVPRPGDD